MPLSTLHVFPHTATPASVILTPRVPPPLPDLRRRFLALSSLLSARHRKRKEKKENSEPMTNGFHLHATEYRNEFRNGHIAGSQIWRCSCYCRPIRHSTTNEAINRVLSTMQEHCEHMGASQYHSILIRSTERAGRPATSSVADLGDEHKNGDVVFLKEGQTQWGLCFI